jgi:hypothetical protein
MVIDSDVTMMVRLVINCIFWPQHEHGKKELDEGLGGSIKKKLTNWWKEQRGANKQVTITVLSY